MTIYIQNLKNVFLRFLFLLFLFQVARLWFYVSNSTGFDVKNYRDLFLFFFYGIRFDLVIIAFFDGLFLLLFLFPGNFKFGKIYQKTLKIAYVFVNSILMLSILADSQYFKFTKKHATSFVFEMFGVGGNADDGMRQLPGFIVEYWYISLGWLAFIFALYYFFFTKQKIPEVLPKYKLKLFFKEISLIILLIAGGIVAARGGFQLKPISVINAGQYAGVSNAPIILNTPFTIIKSLAENPLQKKEYFSQEKSEKIYNLQRNFKTDSVSFIKKNVIIFILESFSKEYGGFLNQTNGNMPFLDSLMQQGLCFENAFADGTQSIEAVPSVIAGLPSMSDVPFIVSAYSTNKFESLPSLLEKKGYQTAFFHGGHRGTMGFDNFAKIIGIDSIFEMPEYPNKDDYDGRWGIYDEPFLQFTADKINNFNQPFFSYIFTLSSHHPFKLPKKHVGSFNNVDNKILKTIQYSDFALKLFFEKAKKMPWYNNTLFVFTADHTGPILSKNNINSIGKFAIPMVYFCPSDTSLKYFDKQNVTRQADILPSVLDYLHFDIPFLAFGTSVFNKNAPHFSVEFRGSFYQMMQGNYLLIFNGQIATALYNFKTDKRLQENILNSNKAEALRMETLIKAFIQNYNNRTIQNKLVL